MAPSATAFTWRQHAATPSDPLTLERALAWFIGSTDLLNAGLVLNKYHHYAVTSVNGACSVGCASLRPRLLVAAATRQKIPGRPLLRQTIPKLFYRSADREPRRGFPSM